ncbi:FAD/NAD(P)-binding protein [Streptosporangium sp. NBC_01756]|uniref:FAD/NAD(P)-binding protein n=1 Tax=Streptosporangium sp. NBC_01756 TaxID=2975950 RepID=UPI002DD8E1AF|nr:FAD/NAD(P)-binding protein [Streptosporangium sp. NBC_01756]WSC90438.1 FAD/NAD(P)-binding protein [Streptosporangium sp. NBC_01756]
MGGTATAIRLLRFAREPLQVVLLERHPEYRGAGVAYHRAGNHWHHVFNIQAGRMSVFREDVDDFVSWANHEADRIDWPAEWRSFKFTESGPAPRRIYPDYLASRLAEAAREASEGVTLVEADGEVVDLEVLGDHVHVVVENLSPSAGGDGTDRTVLEADHVILATGLETKRPFFAAGVMDHPSFVRHPYSETGIERFLGLRQDAVVAVVGTLLSAYDSVTLLLRRGHTGKIYMISRSGLTLRTYPPDHQHRVLSLPPPRLHNDVYEGREDLVRRFKDEWERACATVASDYPEVSPAVITERVAKSWEPYLPEILERVPSSDLRSLLDSYGSLLAILRVGAVAYTTEMVDAAMADGRQVILTAGRVEEIRSAEAGTLVLSVAGQASTQTIEADLVISNFGRESDYERVDSPLWANLLRREIALPHRRTGRGVEVDGRGNLVGPTGDPTGPISVIGGPREGDEIVRYGRAGAFAFNLAAIKNHSVEVAATVLHRLESCYDEQADDVAATLAGTPDREANEAALHAIMLDVRRMAARRRGDRQALATRLEESIQAIQNITARKGGIAATDRTLRFAVSAAATVKLKDLSVTPRDLRALLGLAEPVDPGN